jgi:hypothetical protein
VRLLLLLLCSDMLLGSSCSGTILLYPPAIDFACYELTGLRDIGAGNCGHCAKLSIRTFNVNLLRATKM